MTVVIDCTVQSNIIHYHKLMGKLNNNFTKLYNSYYSSVGGHTHMINWSYIDSKNSIYYPYSINN